LNIKCKRKVRDFAPSGMMEFWNIGKMEKSILTLKFKMEFPFKPTIPSFHDSIIP
jgi:hypothetical protein